MEYKGLKAKLLSGLVGTTMVLAVPASAQQLDWTGFYGGVVVGATKGSNKWSERSVPTSNTAGDFSGGGAGLTLGFNRAGGNLIWGFELDASKMNADATSVSGNGFGCPAAGCTTSIDRLVTLRARVGMASGDWLPYVTAGAAMGSVEGTTPGTVHGSDNLSGFAVGLGVERAFSSNFSGKIELLHTDLGRLELPNACGSQCYTDVKFTSVRVGLNYHF